MTRLEYTIPEAWVGQKLSLILRQKLGFSAILMRQLRQTPDSVRLDDLAAPLYICPQIGQKLTVYLPDDPPSDVIPVEGALSIVYEDAHFLIVNKPAGLCVHPGPNHREDTLGNYLAWRDKARGESRLFRPVNRLDRGTSGLVCVAKHAYAADRLRQLMNCAQWHKGYLAVCEGVPTSLSGIIDAPIGRKDGSVLMREVRPDGKNARTRYAVLSSFEGRALVQLWPETGRTHQIRVHMAYVGHPLTGDFLYGTEQPEVIGRTALHASALAFPHPITGRPCTFSAPLPEDMLRLCKRTV